MTYDEQQAFARYLRGRLDHDWGSKHVSLSAITDYCAKVLRRRVGHWRDISREDAQTVMAAAKALPGPRPRPVALPVEIEG